MRTFLTAIAVAATVAAAAAQQKAADAKKPDIKVPAKIVTLTGCIEKGTGADQFTVDDEANGKYRVSGSRIERYVGQRVEIAGAQDNRRLVVKGGLWPSPNVAAQAGDMDPTKAAMASQPGGPGSGTGEVSLPAFRVKSVKTVGGGCK